MFINTPINYDCQSFKQLVLPKRLVPTGFVFVWADKENIPAILDVFEEKNFFYVENLVWVQAHDEDTAMMNEVGMWVVCEIGQFNAPTSQQTHVTDPASRTSPGERDDFVRHD